MKTKGLLYNYLLVAITIIATIAFTSKKITKEPGKIPIILSSRWFHPMNDKDTLSTIRMVDLFKPDQIDWMYCTNEKQLSELKKRGIKFSLAINPQIPDSGAFTVNGRVKDIDENRLLAPWMKNWKQTNPYWGCVNSPAFQKLFIEKSYQLVDLGAYGIFVDDSRLNEQATDWGGCMCEYCIPGFTKYLNDKTPGKVASDFNYRDFLLKNGIVKESFRNKKNIPLWTEYKDYQEESVVLFLTKWKNAIKSYSQQNITFLTNNYKGKWSKIYSQFDVGIAEIPANGLQMNFITDGINIAKKLKKQQFYTFSSDNVEDNVEAVLDVYEAGSSLVIPWDVYVDLKSRTTPTRYYGDPLLYLPLYNLMKNNAIVEEVKGESLLNRTITFTQNSIDQSVNNSKILKMKFVDSLGINKITVAEKKFNILYPKNINPIYSEKLNSTQINLRGRLLVIANK